MHTLEDLAAPIETGRAPNEDSGRLHLRLRGSDVRRNLCAPRACATRRRFARSDRGASNSSAAVSLSSALRTIGRCCIRRSRARTTCWRCFVARRSLAKLLLEDTQADQCEMGERSFAELTSLRDLHERQELEKAKKALEEKDRQKDEFIAALAHELRNPLATIRASADALARLKIPDERILGLQQRLDRQSTAMARMLDDLLDASRTGLRKCRFKWSRLRSSHS